MFRKILALLAMLGPLIAAPCFADDATTDTTISQQPTESSTLPSAPHDCANGKCYARLRAGAKAAATTTFATAATAANMAKTPLTSVAHCAKSCAEDANCKKANRTENRKARRNARRACRQCD